MKRLSTSVLTAGLAAALLSACSTKDSGGNASNTRVTGPQAGISRPNVAPANPFAVGQVAPEISGEDIDGKQFKLSDYRGKVVVLDFWGHW